MSALDSQIDNLYQLPLSEFTGARNALAKTTSGADGARVKALAKPTIVPWAMNQVYWRAHAAYDQVMKSGAALRAAQIAALEGRDADVRTAGDTHRRAIAEASAEAVRLAATSGATPDLDALSRAFEALSTATAAVAPGRLTEVPQLAGFEALVGITPQPGRTHGSAPTSRAVGTHGSTSRAVGADPRVGPNAKAIARAAEEAARLEAARKKHEAAVQEAQALLARAAMKERSSRESWERAHDALLEARQALAGLKRTPDPSS